MENGEKLFNFDAEQHQNIRNWRRYAAALSALALSFTACWPAEVLQNGERSFDSSPALAETLMPAFADTTTSLSYPSTTLFPERPADTLLSVTTTEVPITSTTEVLAPSDEHVYHEGDNCSESNIVKVHVQSPEGLALPVQVSADYAKDQLKLSPDGEVIAEPLKGYSEFVFANQELPPEGSVDGIRTFCFKVPQGALAYFEVYYKPKPLVESPSTSRSEAMLFSDVMSHQIYPGAGQEVYGVLRRVCAAGVGGETGSINVQPVINNQNGRSFRVVAWSTKSLHKGPAIGYQVQDANQNGTHEEDTLSRLVGNELYVLQEQFIAPDGIPHTVIVRDVPVLPCKETEVNITVDATGCHANFIDQHNKPVMKPCSVDEEPLG